MNATEAKCVNRLVAWLAQDPNAGAGSLLTNAEALTALGTLLRGAHNALYAGYSYWDIEWLWPAITAARQPLAQPPCPPEREADHA